MRSAATLLVVLAAHALAATPAVAQIGLPAEPELAAKLQVGLVKVLRDPMSAQVLITRQPWRDEVTLYGQVQRGDIVCALVNAKNAAGGYVGFRPYMFVLREDGRVSVMQRNGVLPESDAMAEAKCGPSPMP